MFCWEILKWWECTMWDLMLRKCRTLKMLLQPLETSCSVEKTLGCCKLLFLPSSSCSIEWFLPMPSCHMADSCFFLVHSSLLNFLMWTPAGGLPRTLSHPSFLDLLHIGLFCLLSPLWSPSFHSQCIFFKSLSLRYQHIILL